MTQTKHVPAFSMSDEQHATGVDWLSRLKREVANHKVEVRQERLKKHRLSDQWLRELAIKANQLPERQITRRKSDASELSK